LSRSTLKALLHEIHACHICEAHLPPGPNPVLRASSMARRSLADCHGTFSGYRPRKKMSQPVAFWP